MIENLLTSWVPKPRPLDRYMAEVRRTQNQAVEMCLQRAGFNPLTAHEFVIQYDISRPNVTGVLRNGFRIAQVVTEGVVGESGVTFVSTMNDDPDAPLQEESP